MPHFSIYRIDRADGGLATRLATREAHLAWARELPELRLGGPLFSEDGSTMAGSLMIVECDDLEAARRIHQADPYTRAGLWELVEIRAFTWALGAPS